MKRFNQLEVIHSRHLLSLKQQEQMRCRLQQLLKVTGIVSLCLDSQVLFVEYSDEFLDPGSIKRLLLEMGFPLKEKVQ
ncbi:MAG TPA: hypothetical protein ENJ69_04945, partial [Bacteroidetes bacterium]|nr:hypothetical protein [Bacteroidota bacterium]